MAVVDVVVLRSAPSSCLPSWESSRAEPWSTHLHVLSRKKNCSTSMVAIEMCARLLSMAHMFEKVIHFSRLHQSNIPSTSRKLMGDAWHIGSTPMPDRSTHRWKQLHKLYLSIRVRAEGKHLCKPCYLCNITSSPICFSRGNITL
jgi:hypothetical protein